MRAVWCGDRYVSLSAALYDRRPEGERETGTEDCCRRVTALCHGPNRPLELMRHVLERPVPSHRDLCLLYVRRGTVDVDALADRIWDQHLRRPGPSTPTASDPGACPTERPLPHPSLEERPVVAIAREAPVRQPPTAKRQRTRPEFSHRG